MKRFGGSLLLLVLVALAIWLFARDLLDLGPMFGGKDKEKGQPKFTISKETSYVTGPLDGDGFIDYAAALNEQLGKGITPGNNANVFLWKAMGPRPEGNRTMPDEFFRLMGIESPPENGDYFIDLARFAKDHLEADPDEERGAVQDQRAKAVQRPWTAKQFPVIAGWLKANEKPLLQAAEAARCSDYFSPLVPERTAKGSAGLFSARLPGVQKCRELVNALAARAMLRAGEGRSGEAWQDLLASHRLSLLLGRGATLIESLVSLAAAQTAASASVAFLSLPGLTSNQVKACLRDLQQLPPLPAMADKIDLGERLILLEAVLMINRDGFEYLDRMADKPPFRKLSPKKEQALKNINWDPALQNVNHWYGKIAAALRLKDRGDREKLLDEISQELKDLKRNAIGVEGLAQLIAGADRTEAVAGGIGIILINIFTPAIQKVQQAADRAEQTQRNLHLAFALAAYQRDTGAYPKQLAELAPKYLPQVPGDLFSGKALIYRPAETGYLLYSVGVNGKDEGGRWTDDDPPGDDLTVRIPLPGLKRQE